MRRQISTETWEQIKTAFASGISLREIARNMGISENTARARALREKWTHQIVIAKQQGKLLHSNALAPMQSAALTIAQRGERYTVRLAGISERESSRILNLCRPTRSSITLGTSSSSIAWHGATSDLIKRNQPQEG